MLKTNLNKPADKRGSNKGHYQGPLASGLNRRAFLKTSIAVSLLSGLIGCKPTTPLVASEADSSDKITIPNTEFSSKQREVLSKVQMHLFPDDGNGPSAQDINALAYLQWALTDLQNINDGDPEFIRKGIDRIDELSEQVLGDKFINLTTPQQDKILKQSAKSRSGENWLSLLMYYLTEALLLDPIYGGNSNRIGWNWLEHQAGFPQPVVGKTYRDFL